MIFIERVCESCDTEEKGKSSKKYKKKSDKKRIEILSFTENDSTRKRKNY